MLRRTHTDAERVQRETDHRDRENAKRDFPDKATVEARIRAKINSATNLTQLKQVTLDVLIGDGQQAGLIDAIIARDR